MPDQQLTEDEQAVMEVIAAEAAAYFRRDFAGWAACWAHEPYVRRMGWWTLGGISNSCGWDEVSRLIQDSIANNPIPDPGAEGLQYENVIVRISGTLAYATFNQIGPEHPTIGIGGRVLEWKAGQWRIIYESFLVELEDMARTALFKVNRDAFIINMNQSAKAMTKVASPLRLVAGRLASRRAQETRQIRTAIQRAWENDRSIPTRPVLRVPILLEQDDGESVCVCWISGVGSLNACVRVSLNDLSFAQDKLNAGAEVFGLSATQQRLSELIASGHDVVASASLLGITASTARTHLQRIYDKTGVRNQAALVRTLLSIERPD